VRTTPLVCGNHASVTIMTLMTEVKGRIGL
jgi:hypothetical protein